MATRGALAFGTPENWTGAYNHCGSSPTVLGPRLWPVLTAEIDHLPALRERLLAAGRVEEFLDDTRASEKRVHRVSWKSINPLYFEWIYVVEPGSPARAHVGGSVPRPPKWHHSGYEYVVTTLEFHAQASRRRGVRETKPPCSSWSATSTIKRSSANPTPNGRANPRRPAG